MNTEFQRLIGLLGEKWSVSILVTLRGSGALGFNELRRGIPGVSQRMLAQALRRMTAARIVAREVLSTAPPRVCYQLTNEGDELFHLVVNLRDGAAKFGLLNQEQAGVG